MEIDALRKKVIDECERCFTPRPLNLDIHRNQPDKVKDAELCRHIVEIAVKNIKEVLYKKFNDTIASISSEKNTDSENTEQSGDVLSPKDRIEKYINSTCNGYASTRFRNLFKDGLITPAEQKKRAVIATDKFDPRTIRKFINRETIPDEKTFDLFSIFLQVGGWNTFKHLIREQQRLNGDNPIIPIINIPQSKPSSVKRLEIPGATIIDEAFIEEIKKQKFSMAEFYTAMYDDGCQWFGILHNYDVIRKDYDMIKGIVVQSFRNQRCRMSAIVYGNGGCGKSTLLRRLAIELSHNEEQKLLQEQIRIVWLNDDGFEDFYNKGLSIINESNGISFLVIIEDWFNITKYDKISAYKFLKKSKSISNIRIVIGDRVVEKECKDFLVGDPILLSPDENESIITSILKNNEDWNEIAEQLFVDKNNYQCSLFLLLFIMAYANQNKDSELDISEPKKAFVNIIKSDIDFIDKREKGKYKGLAKAIYYWACIYEKHRVFISYNTFLAIADYYNDNNKISKYFSHWHIQHPVFDRLKIYINKHFSVGKYNDIDFIQFNHDILVDGLSKIDLDEGFSDFVIIDLLEVITEFGDEISASKFFGIILRKEKHIFSDREKKIIFIDRLIDKGNRHHFYANTIKNLELSNDEIKKYAHRLWDIQNISISFWKYYLNRIKNDVLIIDKIENLVMGLELKEYNSKLIRLLILYLPNEIKHKVFKKIFSGNVNWEKLPESVVYDYLKKSNHDSKQEFSDKVLNNVNWKRLPHGIIDKCLSYANSKLKYKFSNEVLKDRNWKRISHSIICNCLRFADSEVKLNFSNEVLKDKNWEDIPPEIICKCLHYSDNDVRCKFANEVLEHGNWKEISPSIISNCLHYSDNAVKCKFANEVLQYENWKEISPSVICNSLSYSNDEIKLQFSNKVLNYGNWGIIFHSIINKCFNYADDKAKRDFSNRVLSETKRGKNFQNITSNCFSYADKEIKCNFLKELSNDD